jgi:hypothetical protein
VARGWHGRRGRRGSEAATAPSQAGGGGQSSVTKCLVGRAGEASRLARNPTKGVRLPRIARREMHFLTAAQVEQLAAIIAPPFPLLVRFDA